MPLPVSYLSISQINLYLSCPKKYEFKYCHGLEEPKGSPLVIGSAVHKVIEEANKRKMEDGEILSEEEMKKIYNKYWDNRAHEIDWKDDEDPDQEKERGFQLAQTYLESDIGKSIDPVGFEARFDVEVEGIPFRGYIDLIEKDGSIRDLKTSKKTPSKDTAEQSLQLSGYAFAYRYLTGEIEKACSLDYVVSLKRGNKVVRLETEIDENRMDRFKDTFWNVANAIDKEVYYRNEGMACSFCNFKEYCKGE